MVYVYQPTNPMGAAMQGYQFVQGIRQNQMLQQQAEQQAQQQQVRQRNLQQALQSVRQNPTPQAIADFYLQFPEMKEQFDAYRETIAEGDKTTLSQVAREAIVAQRGGQNPADTYARAAEAAERSNRPDLVKQLRDAESMARTSPEGADLTARMFYQQLDPDGYKAIFDSADPTTFQKDYSFIAQEFGPEAAAEFARFGRGGAPVTLPLGNGQTYVGPASTAPGARNWTQRGDSAPRGEMPAQESVLEKAANSKMITPEEADMVRRSLGPKGRDAFNSWMRKNGIAISKAVNGVTYYKVNGQWYDNPEGR